MTLEQRDENGRFTRGHEIPDEWREKFRVMYKGRHSSPRTEFKKGVIPWNKGKEHPSVKGSKNPMKRPEVKNKIVNNPNVKKSQFKKGSVPWNKNKRNVYSKETIEKIQKGWFKKGNIPWTKGRPRPIKTKRKIRDTLKELYKNNPEFLKRILTFRRPNKTEEMLDSLLKRVFPNEFDYVGDGKLVINGLNPDWINLKRKIIIELFGEPWHEPEEERLRKDIFAKFGYKTLVIWYEELKDKKSVIGKIQNFIEAS